MKLVNVDVSRVKEVMRHGVCVCVCVCVILEAYMEIPCLNGIRLKSVSREE